MSKESMSLLEFQERFCDEKACLDHLFRIRWPKGFACPRCGGARFSFVSSRRLYQCSTCRRQTSVTAGTVFHKTRTPIRKWFWMIFMMTRQKSGVSILRMQKLLKIGGYRTAWLMGHKIREAMVDHDSNYKLAGLIRDGRGDYRAEKEGQSAERAAKGKAKILIGIERSGAEAGFRFVGHVYRTDSESIAIPERRRERPPRANALSKVRLQMESIKRKSNIPNMMISKSARQRTQQTEVGLCGHSQYQWEYQRSPSWCQRQTSPKVPVGILLQIQPKTPGNLNSSTGDWRTA